MSEPIVYLDEPGYRNEPLRWAWALGAVYNLSQGFPVDLPVDAETAAERFTQPVGSARLYLDRDWSIGDRAALVAQMIKLGRAGYRRTARALVRRLCSLPGAAWDENSAKVRAWAEDGHASAVQDLWRMWAAHRDLMGCRTASFLAFDAARAAQLARCGHALGWIDAAETRAFMFDLARETSATFESWRDYAHDFEVGRAFWFGAHETGTWPPLLARLLADQRSPWMHLPFAFPEDDASRAIGSADARGGPFWTLETAARASEAASGPWAGARA